MDNKNEWDELEKWNIERIQNEKEKSKFYFERFNKNKEIDRFTKGLNITGWIFKIFAYIIILIAIIIGIQLLIVRVSNFNASISLRILEITKNTFI